MNRLHCRGTTYEVDLVVGELDVLWLMGLSVWIDEMRFGSKDINCELFEARAHDRITVALAR